MDRYCRSRTYFSRFNLDHHLINAERNQENLRFEKGAQQEANQGNFYLFYWHKTKRVEEVSN